MNKFALILFFAISLSACQFKKPDYLKMISPGELNLAMQQQDIFLMDVHTPEQQHIKGTDVFIPYDQIGSFQNRLPQDKKTPIYIYCRSGHMGNAAAQSLHDMGYLTLFNLDGGINAWKKAGFSVQ
jgi:rhodanese-related sulfurtransferase